MNEIIIAIAGTSGAALLNFIATITYNKLTGQKRSFTWKDSRPLLENFDTPNSIEDLKKKAKILVIDDEDTFPVNLFRDANYLIDKWDLVKDINKLEEGVYDIVLLDIMGVATNISEEDGLGVLESIKHYNPAQIVIAYSGHSFDLSKNRFWELADEKIAKPSDFLKIRKIIDNLILNKYNPERYLSTLNKILRENQIQEREIKKFNKLLSTCIRKKRNPDWSTAIPFATYNSELFNKVVVISKTLIKFYI